LLESEHFRGLIEILLAALIAAGPKTAVDRRTRRDGICLGKGDSVPEKQIPPNVEPMVLAVDHPKIPTVFPHMSRLRAGTRRAGLRLARMITNQANYYRIFLSESAEGTFFQARPGHPGRRIAKVPAGGKKLENRK
jgi:hypothetical protein